MFTWPVSDVNFVDDICEVDTFAIESCKNFFRLGNLAEDGVGAAAVVGHMGSRASVAVAKVQDLANEGCQNIQTYLFNILYD